MLQNVQVKQDERYEEDFHRWDAFEATRVEQFCLIQEHMITQDTNIESFSSNVTEKLISMHNAMDSNHASIFVRINHMTSVQNENHYHYA